MQREREGRSKGLWLSVAIVIVGLLIWGIILSFGPDTSKIPGSLSTPSHVTSTSEPASKVTLGQRPSPEVDPVKTLYVVNQGISKRWGFLAVVKGWEKAKYTRLDIVTVCPVNVPCIVIKENPKIDPKVAGETLFTNGDYVYVNLNPKLLDLFESQATLCHELGHVLGMGHVKGSFNTCLTPKESYRVLPTLFDIRTVDSFGPWESQKMYDLSGKTVDARPQPK